MLRTSLSIVTTLATGILAVGAATAQVPIPGGEVGGGAGGSPHLLRFRMLHVQDQRMQQEAFKLLVPADWQVTAGVLWRNIPNRPATAVLRLTSPDGRRQFESLPGMPFVDGVREMQMNAARMAGPAALARIAQAYAEGQLYNGNEIRRQVQSPATFVREFVLPRFRADLRDVRIVQEQELPEVAAKLLELSPAEPGTNKVYRVGRTRIEFTVNGQPYEEDIRCGLVFVEIPSVRTTYWVGEHLLAFRAPKGELDGQDCARIFDTMTHSFRIDVHWLSKYEQVVLTMIQQRIHATHVMMEASRRWAETSSQVTDDMMKSWERRQAASDAMNERRSQYMRGVEVYRDGEGNRVELPSGYSTAWISRSGEYIVTDSTLFNPNVDLKDAGSWTQAKKE